MEEPMDRNRMQTDLEKVTEAQLNSALTAPDASLPKSLSTEDSSILLAEMDLLIQRYPSQDQEYSIEVYHKDFEVLALKYSLPKVKKALEALRIKPGQNFFPKPDEVAEEIELRREQSLAAARNQDGKEFLDRQRRLMEQLAQPEEIAWRKERIRIAEEREAQKKEQKRV
jgi:hypothetical protein